MKKIYISLCLVLPLAILFSCSKGFVNYNQNGNWVGRAPFAGIPIGEGASFSINTTGYVGTGINPVTPNQKLNTMYKYTPSQAKRWQKLFVKFNYDVRRLAFRYPVDIGDRAVRKSRRA